MDGLETVFPKGHELHSVIYYDAREGSFYHRPSDIYLTYDEAKAYGVI